ncbi:hypothetical protein EYF80_006079 [Liparis tanakae]|uniref:Uncharacterized protein n=1 Tax=Liparis tanakae TaxID=230148 RepID=A0A4Z2J0T5_9TELE|nr:hypothetical protein EYF80_006079 [Liparis tanakae]
MTETCTVPSSRPNVSLPAGSSLLAPWWFPMGDPTPLRHSSLGNLGATLDITPAVADTGK